jgi:hypothetical protein
MELKVILVFALLFYRVFGLRNELVHYLLTPHYFCLICGIELVDLSTSTNKFKACGTLNFSLAVSVIKRQ